MLAESGISGYSSWQRSVSTTFNYLIGLTLTLTLTLTQILNPTLNPTLTLTLTLNYLIDGVDFEPIYDSQYQFLSMTLIVCYSVSGSVLLLNLLIAMMSSTYNDVSEKADLHLLVNQVGFLSYCKQSRTLGDSFWMGDKNGP